MNGIASKIKENIRNISMGIITFAPVIIISFGSYFIINNIEILDGINVMHMLYVFSCVVIVYIAMLIYSYKTIKLEKKYAFKKYKLNPHHESNDSTQQDSNENSQSKDNQGEENKSVKQENNETADTVAETAQVTEDVGKSDETQRSSQEDK